MRLPEGAHWVRVPRFFGDAMMIHAAIAPLRAAGLPLVMWGPGWIVDLFEGSEDYLAVQPDPARKYSPLQAARMLRAHRPASIINFPKSLRPLVAGFLARVPLRLGCGDGGGSLLCTHSVKFYARQDHFVERYADVVRQAFPGFPVPPHFRPFRPCAEALVRAAELRAQLGLGDYVVFAPGANSGSKRLSIASFAALGQRLADEGLRVVLLGAGSEDRRLAEELKALLPSAVDQVDGRSLAHAAAWISGARALVGMDSGLAHVAGGCGIPTLSVFGPTRPQHSAPWGPKVKVFRREDLGCLECMTWHCPLPEHPCMTQIPDQELWEALKGMLG